MSDIEILNFDPGAIIVSLVPILLWILALLCAAIAILRGPRPIAFGFVVDRLLRYLFLFPLGVQGLWAFLCHVFIPEETANAIGWEPSPFQFEVGVANLGLGLACLYAAFSGFGARAATAIVAACFLAGAGLGHLIDISQGDSLTPGNAGPIVYADFLTPIAVLVLLLLMPRASAQGLARSAKVETGPPKAQQPAKLESVPPKAEQQSKVETVPSKALIPAKIEIEPSKVAGKAPQEAAAPPRIEDELETARKAMRESLRAGPKPEILTPSKTDESSRPRKVPRRTKHLPEAQD